MKKQLTKLLLVIASTGNIIAQPSNGLVAYYPFNGNANDASGAGNNGTINNVILTTDRFGIQNSAYYFNGTNSGIAVQDANTLDLDNFTISAWVSVEDTATLAQTILNKARIGGGTGYQLELTPSKPFEFTGSIQNTSLSVVASGSKPTLGTWYSLVLSYDGTNMKIYVDNILKGTKASTKPQVSTLPLTIGYLDGVGRYFKGKIDDIRIYNRALTTSEITSLYTEGKCYEKIAVTDTLRITSGIATGLNEIPSNFGNVKIYPNPTNDILNIAVSNPSQNYTVKITNSASQTVYTSQLNTSNAQISLVTLGSKGLYYIQILDNSSNILETKKLILE